VRFASVYKNFQEADDFEEFVAELRPPVKPEGA
jgi:transcriptional repressor NrdR